MPKRVKDKVVKAPTRREASGPMLKNRIVGQGHERPDQLLAHPLNWRGHPIEQQNAVERLLETVGWIQQVIVNRRTGHVLDGHLRIDLAMRRDEETIPVIYVDVAEDEERLILATLDPSSAMAFTDHDKLTELIEELPIEARELIEAIHQEEAAVRKTVTFSATDHCRVVVDCESTAQQHALLARLQAEGYPARTE